MPVTNKSLAGAHGTSRAMQVVGLADQLVSQRQVAMCRDHVADETVVRALATNLTWCVDQVQQLLVGDTDHRDWSHQTALSAVRRALWAYPVPWDSDRVTRRKWKQSLVDRAVRLATIAVELERDSHAGQAGHLRSAG